MRGEGLPAPSFSYLCIPFPGLLPLFPPPSQVKQHDVLFLLTVHPPSGAEVAAMYEGGAQPSVRDKYGLVHVRGCEVRASVGKCVRVA